LAGLGAADIRSDCRIRLPDLVVNRGCSTEVMGSSRWRVGGDGDRTVAAFPRRLPRLRWNSARANEALRWIDERDAAVAALEAERANAQAGDAASKSKMDAIISSRRHCHISTTS
jgi:hypothetical protein